MAHVWVRQFDWWGQSRSIFVASIFARASILTGGQWGSGRSLLATLGFWFALFESDFNFFNDVRGYFLLGHDAAH